MSSNIFMCYMIHKDIFLPRRKMRKYWRQRLFLYTLAIMFHKKDYTFFLPNEQIANDAIQPHHNARLMSIDRLHGNILGESTFWDLSDYIPDDRVIFFNNSRVIPARVSLENIRYRRENHEQKILSEWEIFYLKQNTTNTFEALVRPWNKFKLNTLFNIGNYIVKVIWMTETGRLLEIEHISPTTQGKEIIAEFLQEHGTLPLPPYIEYKKEKEKDYQTSFAEKDWSVAAPTASLHFTEALLQKLPHTKKYITLHVWIGTFKWIDTDDVREYAIHRESIEISTQTLIDIADLKLENKKIVAVGTTACRTLESLPYVWSALDPADKKIFQTHISQYWDTLAAGLTQTNWIHNLKLNPVVWYISFETSIYITPGYIFHIVDDLITNFHIPQSSLLVLVSAFLGYTNTMNIYQYAIDQKYRFYSFGDGMYIRWNSG